MPVERPKSNVANKQRRGPIISLLGRGISAGYLYATAIHYKRKPQQTPYCGGGKGRSMVFW